MLFWSEDFASSATCPNGELFPSGDATREEAAALLKKVKTAADSDADQLEDQIVAGFYGEA